MSETGSPRGRLFVLSAPSGGGKTTIVGALVAQRDDVAHSVSATTRPPRRNEVDGVHYHFLSRAEFEERVAREEFLEWAEYAGHLYGTLEAEIDRILKSGLHVLLDIEVQGAEQLRQRRDDVVTIFILPPSAEVLLERLGSRSSDRPEELVRRIRRAVHELGNVEAYDHVVENRDLASAVGAVGAIIDGRPTSGDGESAARQLPRLRDEFAKLAQRMQGNL